MRVPVFLSIPRRWRYPLRGRPLLWWVSVVLLAIVVGTSVTRAMSASQAAASRFGDLTSVLVATQPLAVGAVVTEADVRRETWPKALLPSSAPVGAPTGRTISTSMLEGEPFVEKKLGAHHLNPTTALLDANTQGVAVPIGPTTPRLAIGDFVDVLSTPDSGETSAVASSARVVAIDEQNATLAISVADIARVTSAVVKTTVTLTLGHLP